MAKSVLALRERAANEDDVGGYDSSWCTSFETRIEGDMMDMAITVHHGLTDQYCTVQEPRGPSLRYRNAAVAADVLARMKESPFPTITRDSLDIGRDWFGPEAKLTPRARQCAGWWEFTLEKNNDRVEVHNLVDESAAESWLQRNFGIK